MLRVVLGVAALLTLGGLVMQHAVALPCPTALSLPAHVDQGIPLATIDLGSTGQPLTTDEIARGTQWWQHQHQVLLDQLTGLLRDETSSHRWTSLYASATADGGQVLVVVGNQGRLGTIRFADDGTLLACDTTPDEVLPIILPSFAGGFRRPSVATVQDLEVRLRYLREHSPVAWHEDLEGIPIEGSDEPEVLIVQGCLSSEPEAFGIAPVRIPTVLTETPEESAQDSSLPSANN